MDFSNYIDISPTVGVDTAVFPGDVKFSRQMQMDFSQGHHLGLSSINTTVHIGAHTDAPNHYHKGGESIDERKLDYYLGECQIIAVKLSPKERISIAHIENSIISTERVLFKTSSFPNPNQWNDDFNSLSPDAIEYLAAKQVKLIGIDTPSVDPADDKELLSHTAIAKNNMAILEGIVLDHVKPGAYKLIALPLKLKDCDASPVRAILIPKEHNG